MPAVQSAEEICRHSYLRSYRSTGKRITRAPAEQFDRVCEIWFEGEEEWFKACVEGADKIAKPAWAEQEKFPYLRPQHNIASIFTGDMATMDAYSQYHGYITMR